MSETERIAVITDAKPWDHSFKSGTRVKVKPAVTKGVFIATDAKGKEGYVKPNEFAYESH
jgi:hypothetical protein